MTAEDLEQVFSVVTKIATEVTAKEADHIDRDYAWPADTMAALADAKLTGLVVPTEHGGLGHGLFALARCSEILAYECGSSGLCFGMHNVGAMVLSAKATPEQVDRYLQPIARGKHITTLALSEPGTGSHFYFPQTQMRRTGDGFVVDGEKSFVTNGGYADSYVVSTVAADPDAPPGHFSCILVPKEGDGIEWGKPWRGMGMRGNSSRNVVFKGHRIPNGDLLGAEGDQIWFIFNVVAPYFLASMAGTYLGVAQRAFNEARSHLLKRTYAHSGGRLGEVDVLQHKLGRTWASLERTRRLIYWAAHEAETGGPQALPALTAMKADVAEMAVGVINECLTLAGGQGFREGGMLERLMRDARAADVMAPTTDILHTWTGRALLDLPLLGE